MFDDNFISQWKDYLFEHKNFEGAAKDSYKDWTNKYIKKKGDGPKEKAEKALVPGKIYTCLYFTKENVSETKYVNHLPVFFSMGKVIKNGKEYETGIDLITIPFKMRMYVMDRLYKFYKATFIENYNNINDGKSGKKGIRIDYDLAKKILNKTGWEMAYVTLDRTKMTKLSIMDYEDWIITIALYTKGIRGKQINSIYSDYVKNISSPKDKNK